MSQHFTPVSSGARLSDQVAEQLSAEIKQGRLAPGDKLPTEAALVTRFAVSRTVVREALSRLKSLQLVDSAEFTVEMGSMNRQIFADFPLHLL